MPRPKNSKNKIRPLRPFNPAGDFNAQEAREQNMIGKRLADARKRAHLTQPDVVNRLALLGVTCQAQAISKWEKGETVPTAYNLIALMIALEIHEGFAYFSGALEENPVRLNVTGMNMLKEYEDYLISTGKYVPVERHGNRHPRSYYAMEERLFIDQRASAGPGVTLSDEEMELRSFPARTIPADADFAIQIDGNSMEPFYRDGQIVWIKRTPELSPGDVGLFIVDDEGFIKVYEEEEPKENEMDEYADSDGRIRPKIVLISYNEEYPPRYISPNTRFEIVGKVVG